MRPRTAFIGNLLEQVKGSLWFVPTLAVLAAVALALVIPAFERGAAAPQELGPLSITISPAAARTLLGAIAGSLVTVVALVFSVTFLALQQAATRYTPRIIGDFLNDRTNQIVLGVYLATFAHAILVMAQVRESTEETGAFVPTLSVLFNVGLAMASLAAFIWFMHHIAVSLQVSHILGSLAGELRGSIDRSTSEPRGEPEDPNSYDTALKLLTQDIVEEPHLVLSEGAGYLRRIDKDFLFGAFANGAKVVQVVPRVGQFVQTGSVLLRVWGASPDDPQGVRQAFVLGVERSLTQDPLFGIDHIVDIGLRALSPGINDPMTAIQCLDQVGDGLNRIGHRNLTSPTVTMDYGTIFLFNEPQYEDFVEAGIGPLRRAPGNLEVLTHVLRTIFGIVSQLDSNARKAAYRRHVEGTLDSIRALAVPGPDKQSALDLGKQLLERLPGRPSTAPRP